ncbi:MAG TPA: hypothetical protein VD865_17790 [Stenotrophomonas sp.]|nr:hypothetical protein [Stenotrophomonas sp.]
MQQQLQAATPARPQIPGTGPGAEATTPAVAAYERAMGECSATITMHVTHDTVVVAAVLHMGQHRGASQRWERRRGAGQGWKLVEGPRLWTADEERISTELADFMDGLDFPFALANMLPRPASAGAAAAIAAAAEEVSRG